MTFMGIGVKIVDKINLGNNVSIASQSLVNKSFDEDDIMLVGMPVGVKKGRWHVIDGGSYQGKVERIRMLKN